MKRLFTALSVAIIFLPLLGQNTEDSKWKDLSFLWNTKKMALVIDYSNADILGEDFPDFVKGELNWDSYEPEIRSKFIRAFNKEADDGHFPHRIGSYDDAMYTMVIKVQRVAQDGSEIFAVLQIVNTEGAVQFERRVRAEKGRFGSVCNLMGDAMEKMGDTLGSKVYDYGIPKSRHYDNY